MQNRDDDESRRSFASPPCFMHELDPDYLGLPRPADAQQAVDVRRWRIAERRRLIAGRMAMGSARRRDCSERIAAALERAIGEVRGLTVGVYWPIRGEPDLRGFMRRVAERGGRCALPVVAEQSRPLVFRTWAVGEPLERGVWNIPVPAGGKAVVPDVVVAPVVGFDRACYRLGNGGGYFDRTLAVLRPRPRVFGVGYAQAALPTIYPQPHDIPMDLIVTEAGVVTPCTSAT